MTGVSFVIPVRNGARTLEAVLESVLAQADGRPMEIVCVEDGSTDTSPEILERFRARGQLRVIPGPRRGAAAAINIGLGAVSQPIVCQVDQDVLLHAGWLEHLVGELDEDLRVAAVQGWYETDPQATYWARVMGLDLEDRYSRIRDHFVDHICTGNSAYRRDVILAQGGFDEQLGYGYDNDLSYRLTDAGHRLVFCREARSTHRWKETLLGYFRQQYGMGYGRIDLIWKHRKRYRGDAVSRFGMIAHAPLMLLALVLLFSTPALALAGGPWRLPLWAGGGIVALLAAERALAGLRARRRFGDRVALLFAPVHLLRDLAWSVAILMWVTRRLLGHPQRPTHSM
jgi:cellulose synthase/poly-beta-1,6-N-acetylglucosamine synthase-like glycosyltransferase